MGKIQIQIPKEKIEAFCRKWQITEFALFGSVLRE
jgi:predicted nucleotidyltransferase